jgi:hypothetical protein
MKTIDLERLNRTVEALRKELHPDLDSDFLEAVVLAEHQNGDNDQEALRAIELALRTLLAARGVE